MIPAIRQKLNLPSYIILLLVCTILRVQFTLAQEAWTDDDFEKHIRPIFINRCAECHGAETQWAELRVDSLENLLQGGEHGPALLPGKPEASLLIQAVERTGELQMPPETPLSVQEVSLLKRWILQGAYWPKNTTDSSKMDKETLWKSHWAFQPIRNVTPPEFDEGSVATPVDAFILSQLQAKGLALSPATDKRTLIRRLYFSVIGLPPTHEEVQNFVADNSPEAYSKLIDRLLDHQAYGEHWGRLWLDVARYSDTKGYVYGREEKNFIHAYVYRDWVCRAFTEDMPYDQFIQLQLAADQLTEPGDPNRAAMGFLTLGRRFLGVSHDIIDDRIDAISRGLLGMTASCARCHDHKYDPIPTADYYSLYGVFLNSTEKIERLNPIAGPQSGTTTATWEEELNKRQTALANKLASARQDAAERMRSRIADYFVAQSELEKYPQEGFDQILATSDLIPNLVRRLQMMLTAAGARGDRRFTAWHAYSQLSKEKFADEAIVVTKSLQELDDKSIHPKLREVFQTPPTSFREVCEKYGQLFAEIHQQWQQLQTGANATTNGSASLTLSDPAAEELRLFLYDKDSPCEIPNEHISSIEGLFDSNTCTELWKLQGEVDRWILQPGMEVPFTTLMVDRTTDYPAQVFRRGNPAQKKDIVSRHMLTLFNPTSDPFRTGSGRLELARAITDPNNQLTARVWVNRVWKQHFGAGLVRTPSDFGIRAEAPSHPLLLDWLASEFIKSGWSTKALHRWILLSKTYQQASSPDLTQEEKRRALEIDPDNRLLWHYSPQRLSFEMMRDSWLAITGELSTKVGGRSGDLFAAAAQPQRRTMYASIDRQFVPGVLRMFDYANPDMHAPQRSETTVPQQALFSMNHPFIAQRAKELIRQLDQEIQKTNIEQRINWLTRRILQREPSAAELELLRNFISPPEIVPKEDVRVETTAWSYGYGEISVNETIQVKSFTALPFFSGNSWQGSGNFPDATLGWVRLTSDGGHPGNDLNHAAIRRWTSPIDGHVRIKSLVEHQEAEGDGIRCTIISNRHGMLASQRAHKSKWDWEKDMLEVKKGDTLDFVTDIFSVLNTDQYLWKAVIEPAVDQSAQPVNSKTKWDSAIDFTGPALSQLNPWEQLAQVLMLSNELLFIE